MLNWKLSKMAGIVLVAALSGCSTLTKMQAEQAVRPLVEHRWAAILKADYLTDYALQTPAYRAAVSAEDHKPKTLGNPSIARQSATIQTLECEAEKCEVSVKVTAIYFGRRLTNVATVVIETWLKEDGRWWVHTAL